MIPHRAFPVMSGPMISGRLLPGLAGLLLLGGCVGSLLSGGKPDALYRFGTSQPVAASAPVQPAPQPAPARRTIVLLKAGFAAEVSGDRLLATHAGSARYIKGMRWVAGAPGLFTEAMARSFDSRAPGLRFTTTQGGDLTGYALALAISRFEAQYDADAMVSPPTILIEGDATLYGLADRKAIATRHFSTQAVAGRNDAERIVAAFDHATDLYTAQVSDWVVASASDNPR
jgi:cholesterol transport system auxiliary component